MPETKITAARLRDHFRRLWYVYLAGAVLALFLNHLAFTVTRPTFSDDETLKIMLLNADVQIDQEALLARTQHLGFRTVETVPLAAAADPTGEMLLMVQLTGGFGDIYITDDAGMNALAAREACVPGEIQLENGLHITAIANTTTPDSTLAALPVLAELITE